MQLSMLLVPNATRAIFWARKFTSFVDFEHEKIPSASGPCASRSFGIFSCSKATNEMNYLAGKFARQVMGTNNIDSCNRT